MKEFGPWDMIGLSRGKSRYQAHLREAMLAAGKTVLVVTPHGMFKHKRKGHLTLIEEYKRNESRNRIYLEDCPQSD